MKIKFIRHHPDLSAPFNDWRNLTLEEYDKLAQGLVDPDIDITTIKKYYNPLDFISFQKIISSDLTRARLTAEFIRNQVNKPIEIIYSPLLREVFWSPKIMIDKTDFEKAKASGKLNLYPMRINCFLNNIAESNISNTIAKINEFEKYLKSINAESVLCITHSFLLKIIYLYFIGNKQKASDITVDDLINVEVNDVNLELK